MPRLVERNDGCYIVRHFYHDSATWQIDADGVRYLHDLGIRVGDLFATDVFMDMLTRGLVYTSNRPRMPQPLVTSDSATSSDPELLARAVSTFRALYGLAYPLVYEVLAPDLRAVMTIDEFVARVKGQAGIRLVAWHIRALGSSSCDDESTPEIDRRGTVIVDFETVDNDGERRKCPSRKELWLHTNGAWYWIWRDWHEEA